MLMTKILIWTLVACRLLFGRAERFVRTEHVVYHLAQMVHELFTIFGLGVTDGAVAYMDNGVVALTLGMLDEEQGRGDGRVTWSEG